MKRVKIWGFIAIILFAVVSCEKNAEINSSTSALNLVNATINSPALGVNFSPISLSWSQTTYFQGPYSENSSVEFSLPSGQNTVNLISADDTSNVFFHGSFNLRTGITYSLYLTGQVPHMDTLFMQDQIPTYKDSVDGVRFINLSPDSPPLNIRLQNATSSEFAAIDYKKVTDFKPYPVTNDILNNGGYFFEVTDAAGNTLTGFNWIPPLINKSNTLVITGNIADNSISVFQVNNFGPPGQ